MSLRDEFVRWAVLDWYVGLFGLVVLALIALVTFVEDVVRATGWIPAALFAAVLVVLAIVAAAMVGRRPA